MANLKTIVNLVAAETNTTKVAAEAQVRATLEALAKAIVEEGEVSLPGFGIFRVKDTEARTARNPKTGEEVAVEASRRLSFKASSILKAAVKA